MVFLAPFPFLIDKESSGLAGKADAYTGNVAWVKPSSPKNSPRLRAAPSMEAQRCEVLLTLDFDGAVVDVHPTRCSDQALQVASWGLRRWRFTPPRRFETLMLPVVVHFGVEGQDILLVEALPYSLAADIPESGACRFHLWRDSAGSIIDASPVSCDEARWRQVYESLAELALPPFDGSPEELCLSINAEGELFQESPFDHDWMRE